MYVPSENYFLFFLKEPQYAYARIISVSHTTLQRNIIAYVDHHNTPDRVYIFSEFAPGTTLVEYYRDNNNYVTERDSRFIFQQICDAVDYLHQRGIIHRDIKSEVGERAFKKNRTN
jgi:serine/threonine protein kinase